MIGSQIRRVNFVKRPHSGGNLAISDGSQATVDRLPDVPFATNLPRRLSENNVSAEGLVGQDEMPLVCEVTEIGQSLHGNHSNVGEHVGGGTVALAQAELIEARWIAVQ